jgi:hypothetical protein
MDQAPAVLIAEQRVPRSTPAPHLRLLTELEPRHRVFFGNLADLLLRRRVPQVRITSRPARFWDDVFVPSGARWSSILESMLLHLLLIVLVVWGQSRVWVEVKLFPQREAFHRPITYYPPAPSFRAANSRSPGVRARPRAKQPPVRQPAHQAAMPVTPEHKAGIVTPPDIKQATAKLPNLLGSHAVTPMEPFSATAGPRRNALAGPSAVVAAPPVVDQATARRLAVPQASAVAPAPELAGPSAGRAMKVPNAGSMRVVPPPPSVQNAGNSAREGRLSSGLSSLPGAGPKVVPPPPSVQAAGNAGGDARLRSMAGASQVVPPPPSVQGGGKSAGGSRLGSLASAGSEVVPPPPSVHGSGGPGGGTRLPSLSGAGPEVVPPSPSVEVAGNAGGRLGSLSRNGSGNGSGDSPQVAPPTPSVQVAGNAGAGGGTGKILEPMDPLPTDASSSTPAVIGEDNATVEELPLGLLGVVFAAPGSSFFSNFEVFVAKRRVGKDKNNDQLQLIKLVYEFLPYQRRLSEYDLNNVRPRVIKLRVTPDPSCDEALGSILQPSTDPTTSATEYPKLPAALRSADPSAVLPCYRTTAGDFQKAMSRAR